MNKETINSMIDKILDGDNVSAKEDFESLITQKMNDALDHKKVEVASSIYGGEQSEVTDDSELEIEDNELENEIANENV